MPFTSATYHFAAVAGQCPAATLLLPLDGYPDGAAGFLRAMLLETGCCHARAFGQANQTKASETEWNTVFAGPVLAFVNQYGPLLHHVGPGGSGCEGYQTVETMEGYLQQAQGEALRHEAGVWAVDGAGAAERAATLRVQLLAALRVELAAGRVEPA